VTWSGCGPFRSHVGLFCWRSCPLFGTCCLFSSLKASHCFRTRISRIRDAHPNLVFCYFSSFSFLSNLSLFISMVHVSQSLLIVSSSGLRTPAKFHNPIDCQAAKRRKCRVWIHLPLFALLPAFKEPITCGCSQHALRPFDRSRHFIQIPAFTLFRCFVCFLRPNLL